MKINMLLTTKQNWKHITIPITCKWGFRVLVNCLLVVVFGIIIVVVAVVGVIAVFVIVVGVDVVVIVLGNSRM